jgi:hypothetical protein
MIFSTFPVTKGAIDFLITVCPSIFKVSLLKPSLLEIPAAKITVYILPIKIQPIAISSQHFGFGLLS